jgi:hypothetical protein
LLELLRFTSLEREREFLEPERDLEMLFFTGFLFSLDYERDASFFSSARTGCFLGGDLDLEFDAEALFFFSVFLMFWFFGGDFDLEFDLETLFFFSVFFRF